MTWMLRPPRNLISVAGGAALVIGLWVLCGWGLGAAAMKSIVPGLDAMNPLTAAMFVAAGGCVMLRASPTPGRLARRGGHVLAVAVMVGGAVRLVGYLSHTELGMDRLLFEVKPSDGFRAARLAHNAALIFILLGSALLLIDVPGRRKVRPSQALALASIALSFMPLVGYFYAGVVFHEITSLLPVGLHVAALLMLLSLAVLRLRPDGGLTACLTADSPAGAMARRLLPAALLVPVLIGALRVAGERAGLYGTEFGVGVMALCNIGALVALIWWCAWSLHRAGAEVERLVAIIESSNDAILGTLIDGTIVSWNAGAEHVFGYAAEEVKGRSVRDVLIPPERKGEADRILARVSAGERIEQFETGRRRKDGRLIDVSLTICPIRDPAGKVVAASAIVRDISERKRLESAEQERASLRQAVAAMEQVLGVVGHELRTPLAAMRMTSELLLGEDVRRSEQIAPLLGSINQAAVRMADTVNDLLEAARLNSGLANWNWFEFSPTTVCEEAVAALRPLLDPSRVTISLLAESRDTLFMQGDAEAFRRMVTSLADNARRFTETGVIDITVRALPDGDAHWVELVVRDTGCGIPAEIRDRLGEPFALNAGIVGDRYCGGTGLGLAICRGIALAHGGTVSIDSDVGKGTCVTVRLRADLPGPIRAASKIPFFHSRPRPIDALQPAA
jgi:PAS domain S-box-containing protein